MRRRSALFLAAVAGLLASATAAHAAAPRIVIVSGEALPHQIVISDWRKIFAIVEEVARARPAPRSNLARRPRLRLSMFWGPRWNDYLRSGKAASALRPRQADQSGSFYPAWHGRRAAIDLPWAGRWPRPVSSRALAILRRNGVPVSVG